jgi:hypothetical protein
MAPQTCGPLVKARNRLLLGRAEFCGVVVGSAELTRAAGRVFGGDACNVPTGTPLIRHASIRVFLVHGRGVEKHQRTRHN